MNETKLLKPVQSIKQGYEKMNKLMGKESLSQEEQQLLSKLKKYFDKNESVFNINYRK